MFVLNPSWEIFFYLFILPSLFYLFIFSLLKLFQRIQSTLLAERERQQEKEKETRPVIIKMGLIQSNYIKVIGGDFKHSGLLLSSHC